MDYLAMCAIVRDEPDIREWVAYHKAIGFERFYIFDNESRKPVSQELEAWVKDGVVRVIPVTGRKRQVPCYSRCIKWLQGKVRWLAMIDADEFLVPKLDADARTLMERYESSPGVGFNWQMFGSGGHKTREDGLVIERFRLRALKDFGPNRHVKQVVDPDRVVQAVNAHGCRFKGSGPVNAAGRNMPCTPNGGYCFNSPVTVDQAQINHYFCKSDEEWQAKMQRRGGASGRARTMQEREQYEAECNAVTDLSIERFIEQTKVEMR